MHGRPLIEEQLGDRPGMARTYHQLGMVAQARGQLDRAEDWYHQSLAIVEQLHDRPGMAIAYGQMGLLAEARQQPATALEHMVRCVALFEQFPHPVTDPGPGHLVRLTRQLGIGLLEGTWAKVTHSALTSAVRAHVERALNDERES